MMAEGVVLSASAGEHATASYRWEPLLGGSHDPAGGTPLRGAGRVCWGFCVRGVLCVGDGVSSFFANLHLGLGGACGSLALRVGGRRVTCSACRWPAVHWFCVSRAGGPLACRVAGLRSTGSGCRGPAGHPDPALAGSSRMEIRARRALQDPALAGSSRKASFLPFHKNKYQ